MKPQPRHEGDLAQEDRCDLLCPYSLWSSGEHGPGWPGLAQRLGNAFLGRGCVIWGEEVLRYG